MSHRRRTLSLVAVLGLAPILAACPAGVDPLDPGRSDAGDAGVGDSAADLDADSSDVDLSDDPARDPVLDPDADSDPDLDALDLADGPGDIGGDADLGADSGEPVAPTVYTWGDVHSLLTPYVAEQMRAIAARGPSLRDDVFIKVGDSITVGTPFMHCLADDSVDLQGRADLQATRDFFAAADDLTPAAGGANTTPFDRQSGASVGGKTASWAVAGDPSPLVAERDALSPAFAMVMFGSNDIGWYPNDFPRMFRWYGDSMLQLVDELVGAGVVPILSSIPPRLDDLSVLDPRVSSVNALVWGLAQSWQIPFVDYHLALEALAPGWGIAGDGVHPTVSCDGGARCGCRFDATGLLAGYNVRNWVMLEALDRVRRAVVTEEPAPDAVVRPALTGAGTPEDPFVIDALPFADYRDTRASLSRAIDEYTGCGASQDESGAEYFYVVDLAEPASIGALVIDRAGVDVDVHILDDTPQGASCRRRNDTFIETDLPAGRYLFALDTWVTSGGVELPGEFLFVVHER